MNYLPPLPKFFAITLAVTAWHLTLGGGIPEPPLSLYGIVSNSTTQARITTGKLSVTLRPVSGGDSVIGTVSLAEINGQFSYVLSFLTETALPSSPLTAGALSIQATPVQYQVSAVSLDGRALSVRAGSPQQLPISRADRGRFIRVDFTDGAAVETFEEWSQRIFGRVVSASGDEDNDGSTNQREFLAGTDPKDARSRFAIVTISTDFPPQAEIAWDSVLGRRYNVRRSAALSSNPADYRTVNPSPLSATAGTMSFTDDDLGSTTTWFYLIEVLP